jgi:hypothetical protein
MAYDKKIVCLANSQRPPSGRCVAGREILPDGFGSWIRPVSSRPTREISEEERRYQDGRDPRVLDIIRIQMLQPDPQGHQRENHLIDAEYYWTYEGKITWLQLQNVVETIEGPLWENGNSTYLGINDRISADQAAQQIRSLYLIRPNHLKIQVGQEGADFGNPRRRVRADFSYANARYRLIVTDPLAERRFLSAQDGEFSIDHALLCISLAELHSDGYAYKLVASLIEES